MTFAFEPLNEPPTRSDERTVLFYKDGYKLEIFNLSLHAFIEELATRYANAPTNSLAPQPIGTVFTDQPKVFLCYARENQPDVDIFYRALTDAGFNAWMDHESRNQVTDGTKQSKSACRRPTTV